MNRQLRSSLPTLEQLNGLLRIEQDAKRWQAWSTFRGDETAVIAYLHESPDSLRLFRRRAYEVVEQLVHSSGSPTMRERTNPDYRGVLSDFAARNLKFFEATDLADTIRRRGPVPRRRAGQ